MERRRKTVTEIVTPKVMATDRGQLALILTRLRRLEADNQNLADHALQLGQRLLRLELEMSLHTGKSLEEVVGQ